MLVQNCVPCKFRGKRTSGRVERGGLFSSEPGFFASFLRANFPPKYSCVGNSFNVRSYSANQEYTTLESGRVSIHCLGQDCLLRPGEQLRLSDTSVVIVPVRSEVISDGKINVGFTKLCVEGSFQGFGTMV